MNQQLLDRVLKSPRLPSLPAIAIEVIDLVQQKDVNIKQIAHTISHDPALSSKILKTVNSSFYGQAHSIATISHALVVLGLNSVKTLALGFSLVPNLRDSGGAGFDHVGFWRRSLYSAVAAKTMAKQIGLVQQEEAFFGGLLQDLGMLAMYQTLPDDYPAILAQIKDQHRNLWQAERAKLDGMDHAMVGAALAESWNLPPLLVKPVLHHEDITGAPEELLPLIRCVALGARLADVFVIESNGGALETYYNLSQEWFNIPREQAEGLFRAIHATTVEMKRLFDLPTGDLENPDEILSRANETLQNISLQQSIQTTQLQQENQELAQKATTDSLTGASNRGRFNEFIAEQFEKASQLEPLSILFMDVDHFKKFNDTYGHQTGDRVLVEVASVLKGAAPKGALVARYGGEEFSVIVPRMTRVDAAALAEKIRGLIQSNPVSSEDGQTLHVTMSIGVAAYEGAFFARPEQVVKAADQAVYAAKKSGRNCVRVFAPRVANPGATPTPQPPQQRVA
ncbi:MAG: GGDEF domain-containing protein [Planctomycetes bacterium]|nr:GGDEF domain-containing protein [Planctomycetota bacterium]